MAPDSGLRRNDESKRRWHAPRTAFGTETDRHRCDGQDLRDTTADHLARPTGAPAQLSSGPPGATVSGLRERRWASTLYTDTNIGKAVWMMPTESFLPQMK